MKSDMKRIDEELYQLELEAIRLSRTDFPEICRRKIDDRIMELKLEWLALDSKKEI